MLLTILTVAVVALCLRWIFVACVYPLQVLNALRLNRPRVITKVLSVPFRVVNKCCRGG